MLSCLEDGLRSAFGCWVVLLLFTWLWKRWHFQLSLLGGNECGRGCFSNFLCWEVTWIVLTAISVYLTFKKMEGKVCWGFLGLSSRAPCGHLEFGRWIRTMVKLELSLHYEEFQFPVAAETSSWWGKWFEMYLWYILLRYMEGFTRNLLFSLSRCSET